MSTSRRPGPAQPVAGIVSRLPQPSRSSSVQWSRRPGSPACAAQPASRIAHDVGPHIARRSRRVPASDRLGARLCIAVDHGAAAAVAGAGLARRKGLLAARDDFASEAECRGDQFCSPPRRGPCSPRQNASDDARSSRRHNRPAIRLAHVDPVPMDDATISPLGPSAIPPADALNPLAGTQPSCRPLVSTGAQCPGSLPGACRQEEVGKSPARGDAAALAAATLVAGCAIRIARAPHLGQPCKRRCARGCLRQVD
jgi:hypothetical protein